MRSPSGSSKLPSALFSYWYARGSSRVLSGNRHWPVSRMQPVGRVSRRRNPPSGLATIGGLRFANPPYIGLGIPPQQQPLAAYLPALKAVEEAHAQQVAAKLASLRNQGWH